MIGNPFSHARLVEAIVRTPPELAKIGMILRARAAGKSGEQPDVDETHLHGVEAAKGNWKLTQPVSSVAFATKPGQAHELMLVLKIPKALKLKRPATITIFQRNDRRRTTGSVQLELRHAHHKPLNRPWRARAV